MVTRKMELNPTFFFLHENDDDLATNDDDDSWQSFYIHLKEARDISCGLHVSVTIDYVVKKTSFSETK